MIRTINALQPISEGKVLINGEDLSKLSENKRRQWRSRTGIIFQHFHLIPRLTVEQNILTGLFGKRNAISNILGLFNASEIQKANEVLRQVGLEQMTDRRVEWLSGGQKQRVGVARALMQEPEVFLGDEPVASLDPSISRSIFQLLKNIHENEDLITLINVHDVFLAKSFATRVIGLSDGKVVFDNSPETLSAENLETIYGSTPQD